MIFRWKWEDRLRLEIVWAQKFKFYALPLEPVRKDVTTTLIAIFCWRKEKTVFSSMSSWMSHRSPPLASFRLFWNFIFDNIKTLVKKGKRGKKPLGRSNIRNLGAFGSVLSVLLHLLLLLPGIRFSWTL